MLHLLLAVDEPALRFPLHAVADSAQEALPESLARCACGHGRPAHDHYRRGSDCGLCWCRRFARPLSERLGLRS